MADAIRAIGVTEVTYYRWRQEFGGLKADQVKRLKELEGAGFSSWRWQRLAFRDIGVRSPGQGSGRFCSGSRPGSPSPW